MYIISFHPDYAASMRCSVQVSCELGSSDIDEIKLEN